MMRRDFLVNRTSNEAIAAVCHELTLAGFRVEQSFDLRSALTLTPHCACPNHGTSQCNCQYRVLLVFGEAGLPATLVVHGHDDQYWLTLAEDPGGRAVNDLAGDVIHALAVARLLPPDAADDRAVQPTASQI